MPKNNPLLTDLLHYNSNDNFIFIKAFDTDDEWKLQQLRYTAFPGNWTSLNGTYRIGVRLKGYICSYLSFIPRCSAINLVIV